ncbi:MAG: hypothetical protein EP330_29360 [Deltaproteobacteria bacterium]|nr:MAG: hypothetical protein EP330_29360 [Deltaproteobacteria bacterium]
MTRHLPLPLLLALVAPTDALARRVFEVEAGGEFTTIQAAIDAATSGDRILIAAGTYTECLSIDIDLELVGSSSSSGTTLDCAGGDAYAINAIGASLVLENLAIRNSGQHGLLLDGGSLTGRDLDFDGLGSLTTGFQGGGMNVANATVTLHTVRFANTQADEGGAIYATDSDIHLTAATFATTSANNGGVAWAKDSDLALFESTVSSTSATANGGAFYVTDQDVLAGDEPDLTNATLLLLEDTTLTGGSAGGDGGYVYASGPGTVVAMVGSAALSGQAGGNGGAIYSDGYQVRLDTTTLRNGRAQAGGGVYSLGRTLYATRLTLETNQATATHGGGIYWVAPTPVNGENNFARIEGGTVSGNSAADIGGGLAMYGNTGVRGVTFSGNSAVAGGGFAGGSSATTDMHEIEYSVFDGNSATDGGGFYVENRAAAWISDSQFTSNTATTGGAMRFVGSGNTNGDRLDRVIVRANEANDGAGLHVQGRSVTATGGVYNQNAATGSGGALHVGSAASLSMSNGRISGNTAATGAGLLLDGGTVSLTEMRFANNDATGNGGAMAANNGTTSVQSSWMCENSAATGSVAHIRNIASYDDWSSVAIAENDGYATLYLDGYGALARGVAGLYFQNSTVVGNTGSSAALTVLANPSSGGTPAYSSSYRSFYLSNAAAALLTEGGGASSYWGSYQDLFQGHDIDLSPGGTPSGSFNLDGGPALFPSYTAGDGCSANLVPEARYLDTGLGYPDRSGSADDLFRDLDGDGVTFAGGDCEPNNRSVRFGGTEVDGDGLDNDCDGVDGDDGDGDGIAAGFDCEEFDVTIPRSAGEQYYNDIDQDCSGISDWDQDRDRFDYISATHTTPDPPPLNSLGDCDDTDPHVYPGAPERWYDLIDQDCDGRNDFDQDFDTYVTVDIRAGGTAPNTDDCDDLRADVYPGAPDVWYDGVNSDCGVYPVGHPRAGQFENDFDQDGDGYIAAGYEGNEGNLLTGDCNDTDASINPGATEIENNGVDENCDTFDVDATSDSDADGIPDVYELAEGTDPDDPDSDGDGISDGDEWFEACSGSTLGDPPTDTDGDETIDALDEDSDGDGVSDADEGNVDTDEDCHPDYADDDDDGDGVSTADEIANGTDPTNWDTDGDSVSDLLDPAPLDNGAAGSGTPTPPEGYGCGCTSSGPGSVMWLAPLPLLVLRRRRR